MIITDLSHLNDLQEQKPAVKGGHSYTNYSFTNSYSGSYHPYSKFRKYIKHLDISVSGKHAHHYGKTVTKASVYGNNANSHLYAVAKASVH